MPRPDLRPIATMSASERVDELARYLRPPGAGIHAVSTGRAKVEAFAREYLGVDPVPEWREHLRAAAARADEVDLGLLAIPADVGAGIVRGAAWGPMALREQLGAAQCLDFGDVFVVPQLLEDDMLSSEQHDATARAIWPELDEAARARLAVSPVTMAERVVKLLRATFPRLRLVALGGDHTIAWPVVAGLLADDPAHNHDVGIVHFDAHTDLLRERLGIRTCFATWAWHANTRLGRGRRMIQLGIRASGRDKAHWESTEEVVQIWGDEARRTSPEVLATRVVDHLRAVGVRRVYVSNDIDGTDAYWAGACGTPEPGGLEPEHVIEVLRAVGSQFEIIGADLVEVAPGLSLDREAAARTVTTAVSYLRETFAMFGRG